MPKILRMPPLDQLPDGPDRRFVEELFVHYREAGRPTLRQIATWVEEHQEDLPGTASTETIRRVLSGKSLPSTWLTVETILEALCGLAGRSTSEDRFEEEDRWSESPTFKQHLRNLWNAMIDDEAEGSVKSLPRRPEPRKAVQAVPVNDPWATPPRDPWATASTSAPPF